VDIVRETQALKMDGKKFRDFVRNDGVIANELLNSGDSKLRQAGGKIEHTRCRRIKRDRSCCRAHCDAARENHRKLVALEPFANPTGIIDPTKLAGRIAKSRLQGPLRELGDIGKHMPKVTPQGFAKAASERRWHK